MKRTPTNPFRKSVIASLLLMAAMCLPVAAEPMGAIYSAMDVDFGGGTLAEFKAALGKVCPPDLNIVVINSDGARFVTVPPLHLKGVSCYQLCNVLTSVSGLKIDFLGPNTMTIESSPGQTGTFPFVYSLAPLLEAYDAKDIFGLLDQAYAIMDVRPPAFSLHEETSLLIAPVNHDQYEIVKRLLDTLKSNIQPKQDELNKALESAEKRNQESLEKIAELERQLNDLKATLAKERAIRNDRNESVQGE
jgi:hypothetical protein